MNCIVKKLKLKTGNESLPILSKIGSVYDITGDKILWTYGYYNEYNGIYTNNGSNDYICTGNNVRFKVVEGCVIEMKDTNYSFYWNFYDVNGNPIIRESTMDNVTRIEFTSEQIPDAYYVSLSLRRQDRGVISESDIPLIVSNLSIMYKA